MSRLKQSNAPVSMQDPPVKSGRVIPFTLICNQVEQLTLDITFALYLLVWQLYRFRRLLVKRFACKTCARVESPFVPLNGPHFSAHHEVNAIPSTSLVGGSSPGKAISDQLGHSPFGALPSSPMRVASPTEATGDSGSKSSVAASPILVKSLPGVPRRSVMSTKTLQVEGHMHYVQLAVPLFSKIVIKDLQGCYLQLANEVTVQSRMEGTPGKITLGQGFILPGWYRYKYLITFAELTESFAAIDSDIIGMKIGGFGDREHDAIPRNSTLFFQCKLLSIRQSYTDTGLIPL
ncbi:uncharacterized protein LAESUDRAFT_715805 [Laetiporus sulphureus 93-53]|uniref:peptidylprolyl isomerase n=1 Tax=Laetiporus sulphureus 93-53 TaxID=1314785 RepID=A0A165D3H9_9APHY|nr:uncharacterized protein LAESUDRAFT_715805 [Laetiporus sulphureus 93-53]KZT04087.1 hypothetical protein LAESUDRAFT_715805 [Laetiporus sulphureus 93-53]